MSWKSRMQLNANNSTRTQRDTFLSCGNQRKLPSSTVLLRRTSYNNTILFLICLQKKVIYQCLLLNELNLKIALLSCSPTDNNAPFSWIHRYLLSYYFKLLSFAGAYAGEGVHWVDVHPPPPPPGKKVPLRNVQKRRESSAQICRQKWMCTFRSDTTKLKRKR